jgi:hypothetical protein
MQGLLEEKVLERRFTVLAAGDHTYIDDGVGLMSPCDQGAGFCWQAGTHKNEQPPSWCRL